METFVAVVQEMLAAIARQVQPEGEGPRPGRRARDRGPGLRRDRSQEGRAGAHPPRRGPRPPPPAARPGSGDHRRARGVGAGLPGTGRPDVGPVSEELLHRAIRSNVELAETLGQLVRDIGEGLAPSTPRRPADLARDDARAARHAAIQREVRRLQLVLRDVGQPRVAPRLGAGPGPAAGAAAPRPRHHGARAAPASPRRRARAVPPHRRRPPGPPLRPLPPAAAARPAPPVPRQPPPLGAAPPAAPAVPQPRPPRGARCSQAMQARWPRARSSVESRIATRRRRCRAAHPPSLRRAVAAAGAGGRGDGRAGAAILLRAEKKPVLLRGRDGGEMKRDFLMIALTRGATLAAPTSSAC